MFSETTNSGSFFLLFIALIVVFGCGGLGGFGGFGGRGGFDGGWGGYGMPVGYPVGATTVAANDDYNALTRMITENHYNTDTKFADLQRELGKYELDTAVSILSNNNAQTQLLSKEIGEVKQLVADNAYRALELKVTEQNGEIAALRSEKYADRIASQQAATSCALQNQLTMLQATTLKPPVFSVSGSYGCSPMPVTIANDGGCGPCGGYF